MCANDEITDKYYFIKIFPDVHRMTFKGGNKFFYKMNLLFSYVLCINVEVETMFTRRIVREKCVNYFYENKI